MVCLEAPPLNQKCTHCGMSPRTYRCKDCFPQNFLCARCCISGHSTQPFHHIKKFVDGCFQHHDLDMLGLVLNIYPHTGGCHTHRPPAAQHISGNQSDDEEWEDDDDLSDNDINPRCQQNRCYCINWYFQAVRSVVQMSQRSGKTHPVATVQALSSYIQKPEDSLYIQCSG